MRRIKDINRIPVAPKHWKDPLNGHKIQWNSGTVPFHSFLNSIMSYWKANHPNDPEPSRESIEEYLCSQFPPSWCVGEGYHAPSPEHTGTGRAGGCKSCSHR